MNNEFLVASIVSVMDGASTAHRPQPRHQACASELCLPSRLASSSFLDREASMYAQSNCEAQKQRDLDEAAASPQSPREGEGGLLRRFSTVSERRSKPTKATLWRDPEPYEVYQAIEKKDLIYLMTVRDRAFRLLLRRTQGTTPLLYALRLGKSHREVAVVLLGAFSRYINNLDTEDFEQPTTRELLRALRANLKLAIDYGLANEQTELISSFMQALIMSEGDKWIKRNVELTAIALRTGAASKPVQSARQAVHAFATRELSGAESIAGFDDYCANAAIDLVILGAWSLVLEAIKADPLPSYAFARDDRTFKLFIDAQHKYKNQMGKVRSKRLKWQLQSIEEVVEGRADTMRAKLMQLTELLDNELGSP